MKKTCTIFEKSFGRALKIAGLYKSSGLSQKDYGLSIQTPSAGAFAGANPEGALGGQSKTNLMLKYSNAYKETRNYSPGLLRERKYIHINRAVGAVDDCNVPGKILALFIFSTKLNFT